MSITQNIEIRVESAPWMRGFNLYLTDKNGTATATDIVFEKVEEGTTPSPSLSLDQKSAQILMDDLWASGIRPTEGAGTAGSMRAVERHLEDMRAIVSDKLKVKFDAK